MHSLDLNWLFSKKFYPILPPLLKDLRFENDFHDSVAIFSSGTTSHITKGYIISKRALMDNAEAVNDHLGLTSQDIWGLGLPDYHISGLSIHFRSKLLGNIAIAYGPWEAHSWCKKTQDCNVTVTSIVPTQLFDLVRFKLSVPHHLKKLVVGGDQLNPDLYKAAVSAGWPVLRTFGMTECGPQIATEKEVGGGLVKLKLHQLKTDQDERLLIKSSSLYSWKFKWKDRFSYEPLSEALDPEGYFITNDKVRLNADKLIHLGRSDDVIKISGRLFYLNEVRDLLEGWTLKHNLFKKVDITFEDESRTGKCVICLYEKNTLTRRDIEDIKQLLNPFKIEEWREIDCMKRGVLVKLKK